MANEKKMHKQHRSAGNVVTYIVLILISFIWLLPFVGIIFESFRSYIIESGGMVDYVIPKQFSLDSYKWLFSGESDFLKWYGNTLIIAAFVAIGQTAMVLMVS